MKLLSDFPMHVSLLHEEDINNKHMRISAILIDLAMLWLTASTGSTQDHEMGTEFLAHMYNNYKSSFRS